MCNIRGALVVCCLFLNTAESMIFSLIPKLAPNLDTKSVSDRTNFAKEYAISLGDVYKDGTGKPIIANSLGSATNSDPNDGRIFSRNFGMEITNVLKSNSQKEIEIPFRFNLDLLPSNSGENKNLEEPRHELGSNFNNF